MFACAIVYFLYGVAQYFLSPDSEEVRKSSKSHMMWGIVGLFIMVSVFGIMRLILDTVGEKNIQVANTGDFEVNSSTDLKDEKVTESEKTGSDLFKPEKEVFNPDKKDISTPKESSLAPGASYTKSPFTKVYEPNPLCWRNATDVYVKASTEYEALQAIAPFARNKFLTSNGFSNDEVDEDYPTSYNSVILYDKVTKSYYVWWDARGPMDGGKDSSVCNLKEILPVQAMEPRYRSKKPNPLSTNYVSDDKYYRVMDSGANPTYVGARSIAITNALIEIAKLKGKVVTLSGSSPVPTVDFPYQILPEEKYYDIDPITGDYDYWVAVQALK